MSSVGIRLLLTRRPRRSIGRWFDGMKRVAIMHAPLFIMTAFNLAACRNRVGTLLAHLLAVASPAAELSGAVLAGSPSRIGGLDCLFIDVMVPHHEGARGLASIALTRVGSRS